MGMKDTIKKLEQLSAHRRFKLPVVENINGEYYLALSKNSNTPNEVMYAVYNPETDKEITLESYCKLIESCSSPSEKAALHTYLQHMIIDTDSNLSLSQLTSGIRPNVYVDNSMFNQTQVSIKTYLTSKGKVVSTSEKAEPVSYSEMLQKRLNYTIPTLLDGKLLDIEKCDLVSPEDGVCIVSNNVKKNQSKLYVPTLVFVSQDKSLRLNDQLQEAILRIENADERAFVQSRYDELTKRTTALTKAYKPGAKVTNRDAIPTTMATACNYSADMMKFDLVSTAKKPASSTTRRPNYAREIISHINGEYTLTDNGQTITGNSATLKIASEKPFEYEIVK